MRASTPAAGDAAATAWRAINGRGTREALNSSAGDADAPVQHPPFPKQSLQLCCQRQQDVQLSGADEGSQPLGVLALKHASHVAFVREHISQSV